MDDIKSSFVACEARIPACDLDSAFRRYPVIENNDVLRLARKKKSV
jgi:hypothetical protein